MKVPLYMMSAGDLGLDPRGVESKLQGVLDMCTRWNALLLLDEADIFLEQRSLHELERNKLVSIFLRVLEYYEGIMFLTTNRVETFDPAFQSRIHISIQYEELDVKSRKTVWENFLKQHNIAQASARERTPKMLVSAAKAASEGATATGEEEEEAKKLHHNRTHPHQMDEQDIVKLAQLPLNGRQIKNILKTAQLLAGKRGEGLKMEHVDTVMEVTQHLHKTKQASEQAKSSFFY
ncbi:P-loop containing nucleoside triphosphate hydrolase protein [Hortaea werneckii]|nr:P-loop containing nucleoside triphosphate hydrolase protein [Hortaea werneckii]